MSFFESKGRCQLGTLAHCIFLCSLPHILPHIICAFFFFFLIACHQVQLAAGYKAVSFSTSVCQPGACALGKAGNPHCHAEWLALLFLDSSERQMATVTLWLSCENQAELSPPPHTVLLGLLVCHMWSYGGICCRGLGFRMKLIAALSRSLSV